MTTFERKRLAAGLSQSELARKLGVTHRAVAKWDAGQSMPEPKRIPELAKLLGVSPDEMVGMLVPQTTTCQPAAAAG